MKGFMENMERKNKKLNDGWDFLRDPKWSEEDERALQNYLRRNPVTITILSRRRRKDPKMLGADRSKGQ